MNTSRQKASKGKHQKISETPAKMSTSSSDSENESSQAGPSRQLAPSSDENDDNLTTEQVEKLVQLQDLTGIEDTSICR